MLSQPLLAALALLGTATACPTAPSANISCPIIFDGRVSATAKLTDFDTSAGGAPFGPDYVKGAGLKWSDILLFPNVSGSRFDTAAHKPVEVTINDKSIFNNQKGFRRAGLQFKGDSNNGSPGYNSGIKTLHFSVKQDPQRALNLSHEYLNIWHEAADYSANQFNFQIGTIIGQTGLPKNNFKVLDRQNKQLWSTPVDNEAWQNFAISLDFSKNTITIYYSKGNAPLAVALKATSANLAGAGQYQMGILKKPTGTNDVVNSGYQTAGINEGQIYGGIFVEDSANGCVTL